LIGGLHQNRKASAALVRFQLPFLFSSDQGVSDEGIHWTQRKLYSFFLLSAICYLPPARILVYPSMGSASA
jgi:hypothetical protein